MLFSDKLLGTREVEYRQLRKEYFFGYMLENGFYIAEPEKAVLDQLYMLSIGKVDSDINEWSLIGMEKNKFLEYGKRFSKRVQDRANKLIFRFGEQVVTLKDKELMKIERK